MQPQRGGTANLFIQRAAAAAAVAETFEVPAENAARRLGARLLDRYNDKIWKMHQEYLRLNSDSGSPSLPSPSAAVAPAGPAYLPDEHQPLLVEIVRTAVGGTSTSTGAKISEERSADSPEPKPAGRQRPWIAWPGAQPPSTAVEGVSATVTEGTSGGENRGTGGGGGGGFAGGIDDAAVEGAPVLSSAQALDQEPPLPPSPSPPSHGSVIDEQPPDRRMVDVYESLAERLRLLVRERRRAAAAVGAATPEAGQAVGAGAVGDDGAQAEGGAGGVAGDSAVGRQRQQQLWVAVAGAPGSGKTTLAVRTRAAVWFRCWFCGAAELSTLGLSELHRLQQGVLLPVLSSCSAWPGLKIIDGLILDWVVKTLFSSVHPLPEKGRIERLHGDRFGFISAVLICMVLPRCSLSGALSLSSRPTHPVAPACCW